MKKHDMKDMPKNQAPKKPDGEHDPKKTQHEGMQRGSLEQKSDTDSAGDYEMAVMARVEGRREAMGMRPGWSMGVEGLFTVLRVLPPEMYDKIMGSQGHEGHT